MDITQYTTQLMQFRQELYQNFTNRADTLVELVDAICSNPSATSVVELSQTACFRRSYSNLFKAVAEWQQSKMFLPEPRQRPFWLLLVDVTTQPRLYGQTVADRGMVYQPTLVKGNKPVILGHQYRSVVLGLEPEVGVSGSWVLPLLSERVPSSQDKEMVGSPQIDALLDDPRMPFGQELCVEAVDSSYSKPGYLQAHRRHSNLVTIARAKGNRTFYHQVQPQAEADKSAGHPTWYGAAFNLSNPVGRAAPDETLTRWETSLRGKRYQVEIQVWHQMLMRGTRGLPMHQHPFTLVCITRYHPDGTPAFNRPLWLVVIGQRRGELSLEQIYLAYQARFDIEHFFRFGKQKLLLIHFQTPAVEREETWWQLAHLAFAQLWLARHLTVALPRPWERNLPAMKKRLISPTLVQRGFARIIRQLGTPARAPKPRNISSGRIPGLKLPKRPRQPVVVKHKLRPTPA
ncbi:MAG: transposase [Anaerolineae bacterium]